MCPQRCLTWRIQNIPSSYTESHLKRCFHSDDKKFIEIKSLVPDVINYDGDGTLTATVLYSHPERWEPRLEDVEELDVDHDFIGFTPLNAVSGDVCAE